MPTFTTQQISDRVGGTLRGPAEIVLNGVEQIDRAVPGQITFIGDDRHAAAWPRSGATAALVSETIEVDQDAGRALIGVPDADLALADLLALFAPPLPLPDPGVAPGALVAATAQLGRDLAVAAFCFVGRRVRIGDGTVLHPHVSILDDCTIGARCALWPGTVVRERSQLGDGCILHPNVTIGSDGFGYRPDHGTGAPEKATFGGLVKIPQIGTVVIGRNVEIGAGTCIDRGKFSATTIGAGTKIDNLCQIGHNCRIGRSCVIAGMTAVGGSVRIGDGVQIGGRSAIKDHVTIHDGASLAGNSSLMRDLPAGEMWAGYPAAPLANTLRQFAAVRRLPDLIKLMKRK